MPAAASRSSAVLLAATIVLAAAGGTAAHARSAPLRFVGLGTTARQGKTVAVRVATPSATVCTLTVRYADGTAQTVGRAVATRGRATWKWQIPEVAKPGRAKVAASCAGHGRVSRTVRIDGTIVPPRIVVEKQGFSVRPRFTGSAASFGLMLKNVSPNADALDVYVLVNLLLADGHVLGTSSNTIDAVPAGGTYAYGGSLNFPGGAPITQLEVVVKVNGGQRAAIEEPVVENARIVPGRNDADWVGEVDGELINPHRTLNVRRATLSTVVFDAAGNVIGGGTGSANALLPPGAREAFAIKTGVDAIAWSRAASASVSPSGTYVP